MGELILYSDQSYKRRIDISSKFLLIGNNIDGYVNINKIEFDDFVSLKEKLTEILIKLECNGEWNVSLYQISKQYKIIKKHGYYMVPSHGKLILEHSYMDYPIKSINFLPNKIQIISSCLEVIENWNATSNEDFLNYEINVDIKNIFIS
jgi:hypothetical protein